MAGFTKLFSSIVTSTVWVEDDATLRVWIAMLALSDAEGIVEGSVPGFASLARVTIEQMERALRILAGPDKSSRTPDHEGRRIEAIPGGWRILNYMAYRERGQAKDGSRAPYHRAWRAKRRGEVARQEDVARDTEAEADERSRGRSTPPKTEEKKEGTTPSGSGALEGGTTAGGNGKGTGYVNRRPFPEMRGRKGHHLAPTLARAFWTGYRGKLSPFTVLDEIEGELRSNRPFQEILAAIEANRNPEAHIRDVLRGKAKGAGA